jgi:regulator of replication initiation timing
MAPTAVDLEIRRHHGNTVALEATSERLQASKKAPISDLTQRIYELTKENGQLRLEIKYLQENLQPLLGLEEDAEFVLGSLEHMVREVREEKKRVRADFNHAMEGLHRRRGE